MILDAILVLSPLWAMLSIFGYCIWHGNTHDQWGRRNEHFGETWRKIKGIIT